MTYLEVIKANNELGPKVSTLSPFKVKVITNIMVSQLKEPFEFILKSNNINGCLFFGDYDNIIQESYVSTDNNAVIIIWEACNLVDGIYYKSLNYTEAELQQLVERTKAEIDLVVANLKAAPLVIMNKFSSLLFNGSFLRKNNFDFIADELNSYLSTVAPKNFFLLDVDKVISQCGIYNSFNKRFWYTSKMLYTTDFLMSYAAYISPILLSVLGKSKKALVMDCDNTMWKGIVGEDSTEGIGMSAANKDGIYFEEVQHLAKALSTTGVVLAINSKNNYSDVETVFEKRNDMFLRNEDFLVKKINWQDKVSNLKEIASEINIGIDSLVHLDDSDFEINYIKSNLPDVTTVQVPGALNTYPQVFRQTMNLFYNISSSSEDVHRNKMYREEKQRDCEKEKYSTVEDYLKSLELELSVSVNNASQLERISQMTQKTNQFNLTTFRYTESQIDSMLKDGKHFVFSYSLRDKFGNYAVTALAIVNIVAPTQAVIDTFLMSCRIIGRNVEKVIFDTIITTLKAKGISQLYAEYIKTPKNNQVELLYDVLGLQQISRDDKGRKYTMYISEYIPCNLDYIKVTYGN